MLCDADATTACVIFSAYMEGRSYDKLVHIQNRCSHDINLRDYDLRHCGNECTDWEYTTALDSVTLHPGDVWCVADPRASASILATANQSANHLSNGDDAYGLRHILDGSIVDTIGDFHRPHNGWDVAGELAATKDHTLIRNACNPSETGTSSVCQGNCAIGWLASAGTSSTTTQWTVLPIGMVPAPGGSAADARQPTADGGSGSSSGGGSGIGSGSSGSGSSSCVTLPECPAPLASTPVSDRRPSRSQLTIATWNAEWLFDGVCDPSASPWHGGTGCVGYRHGLNECDEIGASAHLQRAAAVVARMHADVINLVEIEGCAALGGIRDVLNANTSASMRYERYMIRGTDTFLRQQAGLITRLTPEAPLARTERHVPYPIDSASGCGSGSGTSGTTGISKHYVARLRLELPSGDAATLIVLGLHLKAIPTQPHSCHQREGQALVAQGLLAAALNESSYVVAMGDLNDFDGDECCVDAASSEPTSRVLRMLKDPRSRGADEMHGVAEHIVFAPPRPVLFLGLAGTPCHPAASPEPPKATLANRRTSRCSAADSAMRLLAVACTACH